MLFLQRVKDLASSKLRQERSHDGKGIFHFADAGLIMQPLATYRIQINSKITVLIVIFYRAVRKSNTTREIIP